MANLGLMDAAVNRRRYDATKRRAAAERTRDRILAAARSLFLQHGYERTAVADIAEQAGVSIDTVYAAVGRKPALVRLVVDDLLGEGRGPVAAEQRQYVEQIRSAPTAPEKVAIYAAALARLHPQTAALIEALGEAGRSDPECLQAWTDLRKRRAANMRRFAADLRATGQLRPDLPDRTVADLVWATNSPEYFLLLASRGWTASDYEAHLVDLWSRLLLA
jgi:AcrR family transcriptional regulator